MILTEEERKVITKECLDIINKINGVAKIISTSEDVDITHLETFDMLEKSLYCIHRVCINAQITTNGQDANNGDRMA